MNFSFKNHLRTTSFDLVYSLKLNFNLNIYLYMQRSDEFIVLFAHTKKQCKCKGFVCSKEINRFIQRKVVKKITNQFLNFSQNVEGQTHLFKFEFALQSDLKAAKVREENPSEIELKFKRRM